MKQELICIVCPKGCHLTAEQTAEGWQIAGYGSRGDSHGVAEMTNPTGWSPPRSGSLGAFTPACR